MVGQNSALLKDLTKLLVECWIPRLNHPKDSRGVPGLCQIEVHDQVQSDVYV